MHFSRVDQLIGAGLSQPVAVNVAICELSLVSTQRSEGSARWMARHVGEVLIDGGTFDAVRRHCVAPEWETPWRELARWTSEPVRSRCLTLARLCRRNGLRVVS